MGATADRAYQTTKDDDLVLPLTRTTNGLDFRRRETHSAERTNGSAQVHILFWLRNAGWCAGPGEQQLFPGDENQMGD
jgi:hypothetical protein